MSALSFDIQPPSSVDIRALRLRLNGDLVLPGDPEWDAARRAWNLAVDQRPFAVALVESAADVVSVVEFARLHGLRVAPQGTGHGASALEDLEDVILVKTERLREVEIDAEARRARVEAGAVWQDVVEPAAEQGFVVLARLVARRRRRRLHARRRHGLARPQPRPRRPTASRLSRS